MRQADRPDPPWGPLPEGPVRDASGDALQVAVRELLTLSALARTVLARRLALSVHDVEAMEHVMLARDPIGPVELSRRLGVTSAAATQSVSRLESAGHVVRIPHPSDRRRKAVQATASGAAHVFAELGPLLALSAQAGESLDAAERAVVTGYLQRIAGAYRQFLSS